MFVVVIPTFRRPLFLKQTLAAIKRSTVKPDEVCVIDNGQTISDKDLVDVRLVHADYNMGCAGGWNLGHDLYPKHDIIFLNDEFQVGRTVFEQLTSLPDSISMGFLKEKEVSHGFSCFLQRRVMWDVVGRYDQGFWPAYYEDTDFTVRARKEKMPDGRPCGEAWLTSEATSPCHHMYRERGSLDFVTEFRRWNEERFALKWGSADADRPAFAKPWDDKPPVTEADLYLSEALCRMKLFDTVADIVEHLPTLKRLAADCGHVTEIGRQKGVSTAALLAGRPQTLVSYDVADWPQATKIHNLAEHTKFDMCFGNSLSIKLEPTDLLFIDSKHTYTHLRAELRRHAGAVKKYIVLHDTEVFGTRGEDNSEPGLLMAVEDFLSRDVKWHVAEQYLNNNGLMVLQKIDETASR